MVGLGAFTSIVTLGGRAVRDEGVPVTTGNSYAAVASAEAARKAVALAENRDDGPPNTAILGATGAIGRAMALMLAEDVGRLTLVGNPNSSSSHVRERLLARAADLVDFIAARHAEGMSFKPDTLAARLLDLSAVPQGRSDRPARTHRLAGSDAGDEVGRARSPTGCHGDQRRRHFDRTGRPSATRRRLRRVAARQREPTSHSRPARRPRHRRGHYRGPGRFSPESVWAWPRLGLRLHGGNDDAHSGRTPAQYQHRNGLVARNPAPAAIARGPVWLRSRSAAQLRAAGGAIRRPGGYPALA